MGERHRLPDTDTGEQWGYTLTAVGRTAIEQVLGATFHVATVGANPGDAECEANARLIAAAPEMLAVCQSIAHDLSLLQFTEGVCPLDERAAAVVLRSLRAVIAKAEGVTTEGTDGEERPLD
jgi:hypothetical protein